MSAVKEAVFITWCIAGSPDWLMVHPTIVTTWAGVPSFPNGFDSDAVIVNQKELNIPVRQCDLEQFMKHYLQHMMKVTDFEPYDIELVRENNPTSWDFKMKYVCNGSQE